MRDRRSFLMKFVYGFSAVATVGLSIPFIRSLFPTNLGEIYKDVDITGLMPGSSTTVSWLGRSVIIRARTQEEVIALEQFNVGGLLDPESIASIQPDFASGPSRSARPKYFLAFSNCTHLGCEVLPDVEGGFECPCHQSTFDGAGRVRRGGAAKRNLEVPDYRFIGLETIRLLYRRKS